jgi:ABC-type branched-subunit amino acid transport system substrate-binding protein
MLLVTVLTSLIATTGLTAWSASGRSSLASGASLASAKSCQGTPIVIGQIATLTGTLNYPDVSVAAKVAVHAVNADCAAGHPFKLITCDDQNDPNIAVTCAHEMVSDRVVAMVGNASAELSQAMAVTQAAGIPSVFNAGLSPWEFTNALSYPLSVSLIQAAAIVYAAAGSGAKSIEILAPDAPLASEILALTTAVAKPLGITLIPVTYPLSTTDFAPIAAQALGPNPGAILIAASGSQVQPLFRALAQQGVPKNTHLMAPSSLFTPATIAALGKAASGVDVLSPEALPFGSTATNAGITQMRKEYVADGQNASNHNLTGLATLAWSGVHVLADALKSTKTVTPATVKTALVAIGTVSQPQIPTWNASTNPLGQLPVLGAFRVMSDGLFWYRVNKGKLVPIKTTPIPANQKFDLAAKA